MTKKPTKTARTARTVPPATLRAAQSTAGLTNVDAAELVEVHERTWRRWIGGESQIPWATAQWFLAVTGQHPEWALVPRRADRGDNPFDY